MLKKNFDFTKIEYSYFKHYLIDQDSEKSKIQFRILYKNVFHFDFYLKMKEITEEIKRKHRKVIIHVHGGGFVAMTTSSHLIYLT